MRWEITFWLVVALLVGILLGAAIMWAATEPLPPDCTYQDTPGNWQPGCAHVH